MSCNRSNVRPRLATAAARGTPGAAAGVAAAAGLAKGLLGVAVRPAVAVVESSSRALHGLGLMCLGRQGIQVNNRWPLFVFDVSFHLIVFLHDR